MDDQHALQKETADQQAADEPSNPAGQTLNGLLRSSSSTDSSKDAQALLLPILGSVHDSPLQLRHPGRGHETEDSHDPRAGLEYLSQEEEEEEEEDVHEDGEGSSEDGEAELAQTPSSEACTVDEVRAAAGLSQRRGPDLDWQQLGRLLSDTGFPALPLEVKMPHINSNHLWIVRR